MFVLKGVLQSESLILINSSVFHVQGSFNRKYSDFSLLFAWCYEARVCFGTRVQDLAIFEKGGCGCGGTRRLKNY